MLLRGRALLAGLDLAKLDARDLLQVGLAMWHADAGVEKEIHEAQDRMLVQVASMPARVDQYRAETARGTDEVTSPVPGLQEESLGVIP